MSIRLDRAFPRSFDNQLARGLTSPAGEGGSRRRDSKLTRVVFVDDPNHLRNGAPRGETVKDKVGRLLGFLREENTLEVDCQILESLSKLGTEAIPYLIEAADDPHYLVRETVVIILGKLGSDSRSVEVLGKALEDPDPLIRREAMNSLKKIDSSDRVTTMLAKALQDENEDIRLEAALAIGEIEQNTKPTLSALIEAFNKEPDRYTKLGMAKTIWEIAPEESARVLPFLLEVLQNDKYASARATVGIVLRVDYRPELNSAFSILVSALADEDPIVRHSIVVIMGKMGSKAVSTIPTLEVMSQYDPDDLVREEAKVAVRKIRQ